MFNNFTRNQHYVSQVEQKLNSIDPLVSKKKRKIYQYEIVNRTSHKYILTNINGVIIEKNLSINDLYTFEILSDSTRINFENFFKKFEDKVERLTITLLKKIELKKEVSEQEVIDLVSAKFLNFLRNPFGIQKVLNSFKGLENYLPADEKLLKQFRKINSENIYISNQDLELFGVTRDEYLDWLRVIFICITVEMDGVTLVESLINELFNPKSKIITLVLNIYDNQTCLLSDRGYVDYSSLYNNNPFAMGFNLSKNVFLVVISKNNSLDELIEDYQDVNGGFETLKAKGQSSIIYSKINLNIFYNNLNLLKAYNSNVMFQCRHHFYSSAPNFIF